jgi:hypothetical protein
MQTDFKILLTYELRQLHQEACSDQNMCWTTEESVFGFWCRKSLFCYLQRPHHLWDPPIFRADLSIYSALNMEALNPSKGPCHGSGGYSPVFHRWGTGSNPDRPMWDFWRTKWHWDKVCPEYFSFHWSFSFHRCSIHGKTKKINQSSSSQGCAISLKAAVHP